MTVSEITVNCKPRNLYLSGSTVGSYKEIDVIFVEDALQESVELDRLGVAWQTKDQLRQSSSGLRR